MTGSRPCHANHSVSIQNRFVTKHDKAMFLGAVPCEVPPKPHTKYVISMGIKHAVPLGNLDCKDFAGLPVVAVCAMGVCWSPDVLLGLSWFRVDIIIDTASCANVGIFTCGLDSGDQVACLTGSHERLFAQPKPGNRLPRELKLRIEGSAS